MIHSFGMAGLKERIAALRELRFSRSASKGLHEPFIHPRPSWRCCLLRACCRLSWDPASFFNLSRWIQDSLQRAQQAAAPTLARVSEGLPDALACCCCRPDRPDFVLPAACHL